MNRISRSLRAGLVPIILVAIFLYWSTGRMDTALYPWGLNYKPCSRVLGVIYCGKEVNR